MRHLLPLSSLIACTPTDAPMSQGDPPTPVLPECTLEEDGDIGPVGTTRALASDAAATWTGDRDGQEGGVGTGAAVADLDGDDVPDLVLATGSTFDEDRSARYGRVAIHDLQPGAWGPAHARTTLRVADDIGHSGLRAWPQPAGDGSLELWMGVEADAVVVGAMPPGDHLPTEVAQLVLGDTHPLGPAGDLDGDGRGELLVRLHGGLAVLAGGSGDVLAVWDLPEGTSARRADAHHDVTGDGAPDLVVLIFADDPHVLVFDSPLAGGDAAQGAVGRIDGVRASLPGQMALADLDGDGIMDLVVGDSIGPDGTVDDAGAVRVFRGPLVGTRSREDADVVIGADRPGGWLGVGVAVGDLDGDGVRDLVVAESRYEMGSTGSCSSDAPARILVFAGPLAGPYRTRDAAIAWQAEGRGAGYALVSGFDADGDGRDDLIVGSPRHGEDWRGRAYWVRGRAFE